MNENATQPDAVVLRIDSTGTIRIAATRVTLDTLVSAFRAGATPEQIAQDYPSIALADIYSVIGHYLRHMDEIHEYLDRRGREAETTPGPANDSGEIRSRLISRRRRAESA